MRQFRRVRADIRGREHAFGLSEGGVFLRAGVASRWRCFQYSLYNHMLKPLYGVMKPKLGIPGATGAIVAADQLFVAPFVYLPTFLAIKMWSENKTTG